MSFPGISQGARGSGQVLNFKACDSDVLEHIVRHLIQGATACAADPPATTDCFDEVCGVARQCRAARCGQKGRWNQVERGLRHGAYLLGPSVQHRWTHTNAVVAIEGLVVPDAVAGPIQPARAIRILMNTRISPLWLFPE